MFREIDLAFIKLHILYHAGKEEIYGMGIIEEIKSKMRELYLEVIEDK